MKVKVVLAVLMCLGLAVIVPAQQAAVAGTDGFACPMPEHAQVFDHPGTCPICGMTLVPRASLTRVAILVFDGVQIIDYAAPYEVFGQAHFDVFTVARKPGPITTSMGMTVEPRYTFANAPAAQIIVVPGGTIEDPLASDEVQTWLRARAGAAKVVLSVCNGAFLLAKAGLLDGLHATTFYGMLDDLATQYPRVQVARDRRWVDNGKIVTSAGLSSGIDASLHVIEKVLGPHKARQLALHLEYDWHPDSRWARGHLADRFVSNVNLPLPAGTLDVQTNEGDERQWRFVAVATTGVAADVLRKQIEKQLVAAKWERQRSCAGGEALSCFRHGDEDGSAWSGKLAVVPAAGGGKLEVRLAIDEIGPEAAGGR